MASPSGSPEASRTFIFTGSAVNEDSFTQNQTAETKEREKEIQESCGNGQRKRFRKTTAGYSLLHVFLKFTAEGVKQRSDLLTCELLDVAMWLNLQRLR